jgi:CheY-like chemotaxis protein
LERETRVLHPEIQSVLLQLEAATHSKGALFLVRGADDPWPVLWAKGADLFETGRAQALVDDPNLWWQGVLDADRDQVRTALSEAGNDCVLEYRARTSGTRPGWLRESLRRVRVPGQGDRLVSVVRDVSVERNAERPTTGTRTPILDPPKGSGGVVILLVEDDDAVRAVLARVLTRAGYSTLLAASAADALRLFEKSPRPPELLVSDVILPDRTGPELAKALRRRRPNLPVLLMSGYGHEELERRGDAVLEHPLLPKPFTPRELIAAVSNCLRARGAGGSGVMRGPEGAAS